MLKFFRRLRQNFRDTRGVSLIIVFGITIFLVVVAAGVTQLVLGFIRTTTQIERANIAYSAAEGGVELALYDLVAYKDGYQTDEDQLVCGDDVESNLGSTDNFNNTCDSDHPYRFVNFTSSDLSGGRAFWRIFARTLETAGEYFIPNTYFTGDKDGTFVGDEWGRLTKNRSLSLSLLTDVSPNSTDPKDRFYWLWKDGEKPAKIIFNPGENWYPELGDSDHEELFTWTLSGIDDGGNEYALQGVAWESDFVNQDCDDDGVIESDEYCFIFDFADSALHTPPVFDGDVYAGEDINRNLNSTEVNGFNRVSAVRENFWYSTPYKFLEYMGSSAAMQNLTDSTKQWTSARLTINLIATLAETSGVPSSTLKYKLVSDEPWADEYVYIVSEGFAGSVKQTIETRFRRESVIPIFSYVIFQ